MNHARHDRVRQLSYGRLAFASVGAAGLVLVATAVIIVVTEPPPVVGLLIAFAGVAGAIAAMAIISTRITRAAFADPDRAGLVDPDRGDEPVGQ